MVKVEGNQSEFIIYDRGSSRTDVRFSDVDRLEPEAMSGDRRSDEGIGIDSYLELWNEFGSVSALREVCGFVCTKVKLLVMLRRYEYAKRYRFTTYLLVEETSAFERC